MIENLIEKTLVDFGNYLLSKERNKRTSKVNKDKVTDADIQNFKHKQGL